LETIPRKKLAAPDKGENSSKNIGEKKRAWVLNFTGKAKAEGGVEVPKKKKKRGQEDKKR